MAVVLIPVKDPAHAKQRLRALFTQYERTQLAWAMLQDVAAALARAERPTAVFVVTSSSGVEAFVRREGWDLLREENQHSESFSVDWASTELKKRGFRRVLRLPGDVPLVQAWDIDLVIDTALAETSSVIVPSRDGTGTNALLRNPPDAFPSRFGPDSCRLHHQEARSRQVRLVALANERIGLDIDDPADLAAFFNRSLGGHTLDFLLSIGAQSRLENATA
ncbi:MAG: 2-phospho-L-lactate guanylyltransferase [Acidobacteriota bacterium]